MKIIVYCAGGTIDKVYFDKKSAYAIGAPQVGPILREAGVTIQHRTVSLLKKDSLEMTARDRRRITDAVRKTPARHILITHGTDTMVQTAKALEKIRHKVIVLTGAMQPARFKTSDAPFNIGFAVAAVQILPPGVYIAMNGRIFRPDQCRKNRAQGRFESHAVENIPWTLPV